MAGDSGPQLPPSKFTAGYTTGDGVDGGARPPGATSVTHSARASSVAAVGAPHPPAGGSNALATASLVAVLLFGVFVVPATIPMGLVARSQIRRRGQSGGGVANAALVVSGAYAFIAVVAAVLWVLIPGDGA
jgi:Domain of unknown function (DUF4190)